MREPDLALVFTADPWVEVLHRHFTDHGGARVRHLFVDPALALTEPYDVLVVGHRWPPLTRGLVEELHDRRRRVLGVFDREEPRGREALLAMGVDRVVEADAAPGEVLAAVAALVPDRRPDAPVGRPDADRAPSGGPRVVLGGPAGAGRTELALGLAVAMRRAGRRAALVDADEVAPSLAPRVGLPLEPNVRSAVDAVEHGMGSVDDALRLPVVAGVPVLAGLPSAAGWAQVRPGEVLRVLREVARRSEVVVVDAAGRLDDAGGRPRPRHALTRALVAEAQVLVVVTHPAPAAIARLAGWAVEARELAPAVPLHLVVNRAPRDGFRRAEIEAEVAGTLPLDGLSFVPEDGRVLDAAWAGEPVGRGRFTRAVAGAADAVLTTLDAAPAAGSCEVRREPRPTAAVA